VTTAGADFCTAFAKVKWDCLIASEFSIENRSIGQKLGRREGLISKTKKAMPSPIKIGDSKNFKDLSTRNKLQVSNISMMA